MSADLAESPHSIFSCWFRASFFTDLLIETSHTRTIDHIWTWYKRYRIAHWILIVLLVLLFRCWVVFHRVWFTNKLSIKLSNNLSSNPLDRLLARLIVFQLHLEDEHQLLVNRSPSILQPPWAHLMFNHLFWIVLSVMHSNIAQYLCTTYYCSSLPNHWSINNQALYLCYNAEFSRTRFLVILTMFLSGLCCYHS